MWIEGWTPGRSSSKGRTAGVGVGRIEMKGSISAGQRAMVPPLALKVSRGRSQSKESSLLSLNL